MPTYSSVDNLLVGQMPLPKGLVPQTFVDDATDEIDSMIGFRYATPVDIWSDGSPVVRPARLLLKRVANMIASGRLIMAMSSNSSRTDLHPYGASLVRDATKILEMIGNGEILLEGAPPVNPDEQAAEISGPLIANLDAESNVESFYSRIANPGYLYGVGIERFFSGDNSNGLVS